MPSIAGQPGLFIENQLVLIREGLRDVPAMTALLKGVSDAEIVALAAHYAGQAAPVSSTAREARRAQAGAATARKLYCGSCHLPDYCGQRQVPRLAGQDEAYLLATMKQLRDAPGPVRDTLMAAALRGLSNAELDGLAHYLATFGR